MIKEEIMREAREIYRQYMDAMDRKNYDAVDIWIGDLFDLVLKAGNIDTDEYLAWMRQNPYRNDS